MENLTEDRKYVATKQMICTSGLGAAASHKILSLTLTVPLSITAILGNILIIIALRKVSSLHPPAAWRAPIWGWALFRILFSMVFFFLQSAGLVVTPFGSFSIPPVLCSLVYLC